TSIQTRDIGTKNNTRTLDAKFELEKGWALKSKQKYGIRGGGKRMTKKIKSYLEGYFLAGNVNKVDRMTAKEMVSQLHILADEGEIQVENIPEVTTVANWITRYAANMKKLLAQKVEEFNANIIEGEEVSSNNEQCEYIDESRKANSVD
ncbi:11954_t:CDS:2, partial [Entrophospora sp. SA101]